MARSRAKPFNSVEGIVKTIADATKPYPDLPPHVKLREQDKPFFESILLERAHKEWTINTLTIAAQLARIQADIQRESDLLDSEPSVMEDPRGKPIPNPRIAIIATLTVRQRTLMNILRMAGDPLPTNYTGNMMKQRSAERFFRAQMKEMQGEEQQAPVQPADLLAR